MKEEYLFGFVYLLSLEGASWQREREGKFIHKSLSIRELSRARQPGISVMNLPGGAAAFRLCVYIYIYSYTHIQTHVARPRTIPQLYGPLELAAVLSLSLSRGRL